MFVGSQRGDREVSTDPLFSRCAAALGAMDELLDPAVEFLLDKLGEESFQVNSAQAERGA